MVFKFVGRLQIMSKRVCFTWIFFIHTLLCIAQSSFPNNGISVKKNQPVLIQGATVHVEPGVLVDGDVLIWDGKIKAVGQIPSDQYPPNTIIQDYSGLHIYPSFIELNSDYGLPDKQQKSGESEDNISRTKNVSSYWNEAFHPEFDASSEFTPNEKSARQILQKGFGLALVHQKDGIGRGTSSLVMLGKGSANEMTIRNKVAQHFSFQKGSSRQDYPSSLMGSIALLRQAFYDADWYSTGQRDEVNKSLEAINQGKNLPKFFVAEQADDFLRIQKICEEFGFDGTVIGGSDSYQVVDLLGEKITGIVLSLDLPKPFDMKDPELSRLVSHRDLLNWERAPFGPRIIAASDQILALSNGELEKPADFFKQLKVAIDSGLKEEDAFRALTTSPAEILQVDGVGKLEAGYLANFFVADKDVFKENLPKVLEHWILGEKQVTQDIDRIDFKGKYDLILNDKYYQLALDGDSKIGGVIRFFRTADTLTSKADFTAQGNEIVISFKDPELKGLYRLSGTSISNNRIWDGRGIDPDGKQILWSAIRVKDQMSMIAQMDSSETDSMPEIPLMRFPLMAYGSDTLPNYSNVLIQDATVWTLDSLEKIENASVLIAEGKIRAVGQVIDQSFLDQVQNLHTIDGQGMHITPGIIDEHSHIAITRGVNEGTQSSTAEVRIEDALSVGDINIYRQLAGGVTTAQLLHGSANPIGGQSAIIKMRWGEDMNSMLFMEAPGFIKFALGENVKQSNWGDKYQTRYPQTRMGVEQFFYDSFYRAKEYGQMKREMERKNNPLKKKRRKNKETTQPRYRIDLELEVLLEILNNERFITCHSYVQSEVNMLMHVADSMGFTLNTFTHILEGYKLANKLKSHGAAASTFSDWWAYKYEVKDAIPHNASLLVKMGVTTAINSDDAEMGRRLNQEAAKGILYGGMTEVEALKMITLNPAKIMHIDTYVGSIEIGKDADIVVWNDHPLSVYAKAQKTFVDGKLYFDREEMERRKKRDDLERNRIASKMIEAAKNGSATQLPKRKMERYYHCDSKD